MTRNTGERQTSLAVDIRRQFGDTSIRRFAHTLPSFKVTETIPGHLRTLLDQLEREEGKTDSKRLNCQKG